MTPFDDSETRDPARRMAEQFAALRSTLHASRAAPYWQAALAGIEVDAITDHAALARLPVLRKSALIAQQNETPPFGGLTTTEGAARMFLSPGPIAEPQAPDTGPSSPWRMERALHAAGFGPGTRVANCFSYHLTPAGFMFDSALLRLGCAVFPGGVGHTETQGEAFRRLELTAYTGTPDFLAVILEKADALGRPITSVTRACVTGGPLFPQLRTGYAERGIAVRQCYGTAELGLVAYETGAPEDGLAIDEGCIVEILRPGTPDPVAEGEVGEVVVTIFDSHYPLIRLATGDLSMLLPPMTDEAGRTAPRLKGWMGRADQSTKVRGMFVHPEQVAASIAAVPDVTKARLVVRETDGRDNMTLICETTAPSPGLSETLAEATRSACRLRAEIELVAPGTLPNDGKVIDDQRGATA